MPLLDHFHPLLTELPLWLGPDLVVPVNLEITYNSACQRRRLLP